MGGRQKGNYFKPLGSSFAEGGRSYKGREHSFGRDNGFGSGGDRDQVGGEGVSDFLTCYNCGEKGHRSSECKKGSVRPGGSGFVPRQVTCYNCGKVGHKSPECTVRKGVGPVKKEATPSKMSVLINESKSGKPVNVAFGLVNGIRTEVLIDSGAELGSVPKTLVPGNVELCSDVVVKGFASCERSCKSFMCEFVIGGYRKVVRAIIAQ